MFDFEIIRGETVIHHMQNVKPEVKEQLTQKLNSIYCLKRDYKQPNEMYVNEKDGVILSFREYAA